MVIECSCGMVMSIAAHDRRACLRCGGAVFQVLDGGTDLRCTPGGRRVERQAAGDSPVHSANEVKHALAASIDDGYDI